MIRVHDPKGKQGAKGSMKISQLLALTLPLISLSLPACSMQDQPDLQAVTEFPVAGATELRLQTFDLHRG